MGSALTVLLSFTRLFNLALVITILASLMFPSYPIQTTMIVFIALGFLIIIPTLNGCNIPLLNYHETRLPANIELALPYILIVSLYWINQKTPLFYILLMLMYGACVYAALYPRSEFDKLAADNYWSGKMY